MKNRSHKVPEERNKKQLEQLRADNRKLRKQVAQLERELEKRVHRDLEVKEILEEVEFLVPEVTETKSDSFHCPSCKSSDIKYLSLRHDNSHYVCNECGKTGLVDNEN